MNRYRWNASLWWDVAFMAVTAGIALTAHYYGSGVDRTRAFIVLAVLAVLWPVLGRLQLGHRRNAAFTIATGIAMAVLSYSVPMTTFFLIFGCPYGWAWTRHTTSFRPAVAGNALLCGAAFLGQWAGMEWEPSTFLPCFLSGAISFAFSMGMGLWIVHIAEGAEEQGRLRAELAATNLELIEAHRQAGAARERERFAHEIHDTLTQTLTAVVMVTERARGEIERGDVTIGTRTLATAERTARQALAETRSLIAEGKGTELSGKDFASRIADLCEKFGEETGVAVQSELSGDLDGLPRPDQVVLLRCLQETLSNVRKHAQAGDVMVELSADVAAGSYLAVTDDGVGFPDSVDAAAERGYGLVGIASRLALTDGTMAVTTSGEGTRVSITIPGRREVLDDE